MQVEMSAVRKALCPLFVVASIFGVQLFEYHIFPWNFLHHTLMWATYFAAFVAINIWTEFHRIFQGVYRCLISYEVLASFISTGLTLFHRKKFQNCLESIAVINTSLGQFDIPDEYDKLHMWTWKVIVIWIFMMSFFILLDLRSIYRTLGKLAATFGILMVTYPYCINFLNYIMICLLLWYTNSRFDRINRYIGALTVRNNSKPNWLFDWRCGMYDLVNPFIIKKHERQVWIMMHLHDNLCKVSRELNTIFGLQIALEIGSCLVSVSSLTIYTCLHILPLLSKMKMTGRDTSVLLTNILMACLKSGFYVVRLVYINHICESVSTKANTTRMILHNFLNCVHATELREEILQFSLHIMNRPLKFHAAGMFYYGYSFIYTSVGAITTLLVIILQSSTVTDEIFDYVSSLYLENSTLEVSELEVMKD